MPTARPTVRVVVSTTVYSHRLGPQRVEDDDLIIFESGIPGLTGRAYAVLPGLLPLYWLQSADDAGLALPVADPYAFFPRFSLDVQPADYAQLGGEPEGVLVVVRLAAQPTANLRAPLLIRGGRGVQVINDAPDCGLRVPLHAASRCAA